MKRFRFNDGMGSSTVGPRGTIFSIGLDGNGYTTLHEFYDGVTNGSFSAGGPYRGLLPHEDKLYGMTVDGGLYDNGVLFRIDKTGANYTNLHHFGATGDGVAPYGALYLFKNNLIGTTSEGGEFGKGTVFRICTDGSHYKVLHSFAGEPTDGYYPICRVSGAGRVVYGMSMTGGAHTNGMLFSLAHGPDVRIVAASITNMVWDASETGLSFTVESTTNLVTPAWSPLIPTSQWPIAEGQWSGTTLEHSALFLRVSAEDE